MRLQIYKETATRVPVKALRELFVALAELEAKKSWKGSINLIFTNDRRIKQLNTEYRGKEKPTDVLSFNIDSPEAETATFGEIYISVPTAARQAKELGNTISYEYLRLACHGMMHLFGYDHKKNSEAEKMEARERRYLRAIGRSIR
jgi:probable rRNA maturation factor